MKTPDEFYGGPEGFILFWVMVITVVAVACIASFVIYCVIRDAYRFGHQRLSCLLMLLVSAIFSGAGYALAGWSGLPVGLVLLTVYGLGRRRAKKHAQDIR